ncbi:hypothetical protein QN277_003181 [Acacia crassicarpa]|uniref:Uncharacterized protein n=1 Tax=Acacia crassicarpa TaxID=499986 RepID=A0AAE1MC57_9FABA|nr:hypothetical protein QN277_003181 [Acacia crassicarpa]
MNHCVPDFEFEMDDDEYPMPTASGLPRQKKPCPRRRYHGALVAKRPGRDAEPESTASKKTAPREVH